VKRLSKRLSQPLVRLWGIHSIRAKLVIAFGALLLLGALNIVVSSWGAYQRGSVFGQLHRAIERQTTLTSVTNQLQNLSKEIQLISSVMGAKELSPLSPDDERRRFATIDSSISQLRHMPMVGAAQEDSLDALRRSVEQLGASWKRFYVSMWSDPPAAVSELVLHADPLSETLFGHELPAAMEAEKASVSTASAEFLQTNATASNVAITIFLISAIVGGLLALVTSRSLLRAISALKAGADRVGTGDLTHRVEVVTKDELGLVAESFNDMANRLQLRTDEIEEQRKVSESLLLNILPGPIAAELREKGRVEPKYFADSTILFTDFVAFTRLFDSLSVDRMVHLLDEMFTAFDRISREYRLEKLKTIGDAYMCVGGLTREGSSHPIDAVMAAFAMVDSVRKKAIADNVPLAIRIGIHTGPVAAGVVGIDKFAFDVWGDTVNFAARLQATGEPGRINISHNTYLRVKDFFDCESRGQIETKEKRTFDMYFVRGLHPELVGAGAPPPEFQNRYQIYFERPPTGFPQSLVTAG
jgi:class 3 adenylate cyclase